MLRLFCFASFSSLYAFVEAAALRSIVLRYASAPIATRVSFSVFGGVASSEYFLYHFRFLVVVCMESTSYVLSFRMVFFYLVTTGWIFDISLCENSINKSINVALKQMVATVLLIFARVEYLHSYIQQTLIVTHTHNMPRMFRARLDDVPMVSPSGGVFYDLGCGTGKPVFAAAAASAPGGLFRRCVGLEILSGLHEICRKALEVRLIHGEESLADEL